MRKGLRGLLTIKKIRDIWPSSWGKKTCIMGIINITPDSFSDGGLFIDPKVALERAIQLVNQGADVLDIGAQSTRPGAISVGANEEIKRITPVLIAIRERLPQTIISIDTFLSDVAEMSLKLGADWINDVSGGRHDPNILNIVANNRCPYVITHSRGCSQNMDKYASYENVFQETFDELIQLTNIALDKGISPTQIIWDPGIGFAKNTNHNIYILKQLEDYLISGYPLLVGPSRKRFIGDITKEGKAEKRIWGTAAVVSRCVQANVSIVRVHDVEAIHKTILMADSIWR